MRERLVIYHSDTLAFKKTEILQVLKIIDENFDLGEISNDVVSDDSLEPIKIHNPFNDYRKFLFNTPLLSLWESACIACGIDSAVLDQFHEGDLREKFPELNSAVAMLNSNIKIGQLQCHNHQILKLDLQKFFSEQNINIIGFNKNIDSCNGSQFGSASIDFASVEDYQKQRDELLIEVQKLKAEISEKDEKIKQFESENLSNDSDLLSMIFDDSSTNRYAPDLVLAIKLWEYLYIENRQADIQSHSNMANHWLNKNTGYIDSEMGGEGSKERIRAVVTPFADWGAKRNKKYKK